MKTALDALLEALEAGTWTPQGGLPAPVEVVVPSTEPRPEPKPEPKPPEPYLAACGSPECAGCYGVAPGVQLHPPKCGEVFKAWRLRWDTSGKVQ